MRKGIKVKIVTACAITIVFAVTLLISGYHIINHQIESNKIKEDQAKTEESITVKSNAEIIERYEVDFKSLKTENEDTVAYLKVYGTNIDCVVVKTDDNDFYLHHDFSKARNSLGWVFADYRNQFDNNDKNIVIYGHNLSDGSLFGSLIDTLDISWQSNPENQKIILVTESGTKTYQVFSTYEIWPEEYYINTDFKNNEEFLKFLNIIKNRSNYDYDVKIGQDDKILTLSSCVGTGQKRVVLHAKQI